MARIDDYFNAKAIAAETLAARPLDELIAVSGFEKNDTESFRISFLDRNYRISYPEFTFTDEDDAGREVPIQEQVLLLHYLMGCTEQGPSGRWIAYREIPGAAFYMSAFIKRATNPAKNVFGANLKAFQTAAARLNGQTSGSGDAGFQFQVLPKIALQVIIWEGDEEFEAESSILFDEIAGQILSPEDSAWLAGMLVYRLMSLSR